MNDPVVPPSIHRWYGLVQDASLEQGDFFFSCPVVESGVRAATEPGSELEMEATIRDYNVLILSQSCDLEQGKLETVLVCPHWPLSTLAEREEFFRSSKGKEEVRRGNVPGFHMLAACDLPGFVSTVRVVNFRQVIGLPFGYVRERARQQSPRLRLLPPYREHLAQAFARFIMRV